MLTTTAAVAIAIIQIPNQIRPRLHLHHPNHSRLWPRLRLAESHLAPPEAAVATIIIAEEEVVEAEVVAVVVEVVVVEGVEDEVADGRSREVQNCTSVQFTKKL